ncbi:prepilin peptidase [Sphingomonas baiyangensis]|uniref:Prepilin leader peptidase/N-methyltransferase n=1 Tax=Sphingomonas baiyangensis TaxID=2572576 RepID=A0A4U1L296_9SPHN|nr:A24 family peptidase [Sphingomonas baiyangensis]TKD50136.1 prepilin peptidase [Sphingomonas baiyangensis]
MSAAWVWPLSLGLLGLVFGSFIATLAIRWPAGRSIARGRSACDGCGATLGPGELVPVLSHVIQRGRCRHCGTPIAHSHLAIELLGCAVGLAAGIAAPGIEGAAGAVFGWLLLALAATDAVAFWLPDRLTATLALAGLGAGALGLGAPLGDRLIGAAAGFAVLALAAAAYRLMRGRTGLGGGDPKLFGAIGLWLGWRALPAVLLVAALLGIAWAMARAMRADARLPLGTLLAIAAFGYWLARQLSLTPM